MNRLFRVFWAISLVVCICLLLTACFSLTRREKAYYKERDNYITVTGTVIDVHYSEKFEAFYFSFSELAPKLDDICLKIVGDNVRIVEENGMMDMVGVGSKVEFVTAPKYFGDGYVMPIVALTCDGVCFLEFEEGYLNLLVWLDE